jgi:hypothetical protein
VKNFHYSLLCFGLAALVSAGCSDAPVEVTSSLAAAEIVNTKCPIMGHDIDAADIDPSLLKDWNGKKVAFCCPPCLEEWDELTEAEKAEKIAHPPGDHDDHGTHAEDAPAGEAATAPQPAAVENPAPATP